MRINTNTAAMNTYSNLTSANASKSGSLAKLSSGLRINKAGDDAAGLAISEKMKNQISGMTQASRNAQDGISLIQTAEGALTETHSMLNRMRDLTVQAANDTNTADDKSAIQSEIKSLTDEIDRVANDTEFNTKGLMNGDFDIADDQLDKLAVDYNAELSKLDDGTLDNDASIDSALDGLNTEQQDELIDIYNSKASSTAQISTFSEFETQLGTLDASTPKAYENGTNEDTARAAITEFDDQQKIEGADFRNASKLDSNIMNTILSAQDSTPDVADEVKDKDGNLVTSMEQLETNGQSKFTFQIGANSSEQIQVEIGNMSAKGLGIDDIDVSRSNNNNFNTDKILETLDSAISSVSTQRAELGATQNRLDHTVSNLSTTKENLSEANSRIRDVDMAEEMMSFTKSNILSQASTAMLAQANQMPQGVLQLLG